MVELKNIKLILKQHLSACQGSRKWEAQENIRYLSPHLQYKRWCPV
jgi:hypothetical protein